MKAKFTLLAALLLTSLCSSAQTIGFSLDGNKLKDKDTVTIYAATDDFGAIAAKTNEGRNLTMNNLTASSVNVVAVITVLENKGANLSWCMGGACQPISGSSLTKKFTTPANGSEPVIYDGDFTEEGMATSKLECTVNGETATIFIKMIYDKTKLGIESLENTADVKVAGNKLDYTFNNEKSHTLNVYSVLGKLIQRTDLNRSGSVSINALNKGIYLLEVVENGQRIAVKKCVIK